MTLVKNKKNKCDHTPKNEILKGDITFVRAETEFLRPDFIVFCWATYDKCTHVSGCDADRSKVPRPS